MAKFRTGIIQNISGPMGGITFVNSRYGFVMHMKSIPINRVTESRSLSESRLVNTTRLWTNVIPPQHEGWQEFAKGFTRTDKSGNVVPCKAIDIFKIIA